MRIEVYKNSFKSEWDEFIRGSKNGTFLLLRDYMEYHCDRFQDFSLMVFNDRKKLIAVLPANKNNYDINSHQGLTYGGFITNQLMTVPLMLELFDFILMYLKQQGFKKIIYKTIPHIYYSLPAEEDRYALFLLGAKLIRRDVLTVIDTHNRIMFQERRRRSVKKARFYGLYIRQCDDYQSFWEILRNNLWERYKTHPVHKIEEITMLHSRFPENIRLFSCYREDKMVGGVLMYETNQVAHVQYISADEIGKSICALDMVFDYLINDYYSGKRYFDFGISNENNGFYLNKGLIEQKEGFGARAVVHDHYEVSIEEWRQGRIMEAMK